MNDQNTLEIIFNQIKFDATELRTYERYGIATGYLSNLNENEKIYFIKRTLQNFTLKHEYINEPVIMISHGTGIGPFVSFLRYKKQHLDQVNSDNSNWWLLYGCRDPNKDFLYKNEILNEYANEQKILPNFKITFSRFNDLDKIEQMQKFCVKDTKYVQDLIKANSKDIADAIVNKNAYVYVCGDENNMIKDVFNSIIECIKTECSQEVVPDAQKYVLDMMNKKRYRQDIWG
jgi:sulfite reductase alpha subunit-like flavoprotein